MRFLIAVLLFSATVAVNAEEPAVPALLTEKTKAPLDLDVTFGDSMSETFEPARDWQWHSDVEEALQYLYKRQENILSRLAKVEAAQIRVNTTTGSTVTRSVPVRAGTGYFNLAPGETLVGYQDPITGQWVNCSQTQPTVMRYDNLSYPVNVYETPAMEVRTIAPVRSQPVQGRLRVRMGSCANGQCSF